MTRTIILSVSLFLILFTTTTTVAAAAIPTVIASSSVQPQAVASPRFRLGIVGLVHGHGWGYLRSAVKMPDVELVGIADAHPDILRAAELAAPGVPLFSDYLKMLDEQKPQAVWAFVENDRHVELTKACAERGIHVIFEKPMAATYAQAKEMLALTRKHNVRLMVNYQMAWWAENYTAHTLAQGGELGNIWRVRAIIGHGGPAPSNPADVQRKYFWEWLNDERRGGGALLDFTVYGAAWFRWYLGMPHTVYATTTHTRPEVYKTNTTATVLASFANNRTGIIEGSWDLPRSFQDVEVFGNKGSVYMARNMLDVMIGDKRRETPLGTLADDRRDPISYLINRVRTGQPIDGIVAPEFNVDVMQIVEATRRSAATGKAVSLPLP